MLRCTNVHLDVNTLQGLGEEIAEHANDKARGHTRLEGVSVEQAEVGGPDLHECQRQELLS